MDGAVVASRGGGKEGEERAAFTIEGVEQERHNAGVRCGAAGRLGSFHTVRPHRVRPRLPVHIASSSFLIGSAFLPTE